MRRLRERKIDTPEFYEKVWSEEYNTRPYYDAVRQRALAQKVEPGNRVIDLGAGCFGTAQFIVEELQIPDVLLIAVDYSYTARRIVLNRLAGHHCFNYVCHAAESTPLRASWFDVVIAGELIEHYEDPAVLVQEMARLTKPGGWMVISTVNTKCPNAIAHCDYPEHVWEFEPEDLIRMFAPFGKPYYFLLGDYHMLECQRI